MTKVTAAATRLITIATIVWYLLHRCTYVDDETGQLIETETWEPGTWSGVLLYMTYITVTSEPL